MQRFGTVPEHTFRKTRRALTALLVAAAVLTPAELLASNPYLEALGKSDIEGSPAYRYANATNDEVRRMIAAESLPFAETAEPVPGVRLAGRLTGKLNGVWIHGTEAPKAAATTPYELLDGRLALALGDLAKVLRSHNIVEVIHYTMYRPPASSPAPGTGLFRHAGGLAIDIGLMRRSDGTRLSVEKDWSPSIGSRTCGPSARVPQNPLGRELSSVVCEAHDLRLFHYALTPHFDRPHATHIHFEIKPGVKWLLYN